MKLQLGSLVAFFAIAFLVVKAGGCNVSQSDLNRTATPYGFTEAKVHDYAWFSCGEDYSFSSNFTAKNGKGEPVSGIICCGILKSCTLKF